MAEPVTLLALFADIEPATDGIEELHRMGVTDDAMNVISGIPVPGRVLGRPSAITNVAKIGLSGAVLGLLFGIFLIWGTPFLYPLPVGGQPLYPIPIGWIVMFEMTMLGLMGFSFLGLFVDSGFPTYTPKDYVPEISDGKIAVLFRCDRQDEKRFSESLLKKGAESVKRSEARQL
jgi:hypothetical protein